ncbi:hypothetical protein, partial [uncultured Gammaproteobacteria bacterium]
VASCNNSKKYFQSDCQYHYIQNYYFLHGQIQEINRKL